MSPEPDGFWTDDDRDVTQIETGTDEELVLDDDDDDVDLDDWGSDADERAVDGGGDGDEEEDNRGFYRDDL
ncbi:hypothetical protein E3T55_11725 [Cryobacterium frigoriphilum]|uniref:Uncharacterized protein n=1 Tax=Cryobacterium frigoriphilum TaxID=1259150 RepID=A0A4R8ZZB5_9MICO|nr:hypothetical protein [Cryobacterium frigoriphilum]TFD49137.1 hypothetical protein E3T55_11725 [Cryobacterium frigoriphilum]